VELDEIARGEFAENAFRKDLAPSEIEAIRRTMIPLEKEAARERQAMAGGSAPGKFPEAVERSQTRDKIGSFAGVSGRALKGQRPHHPHRGGSVFRNIPFYSVLRPGYAAMHRS
jgi:hypothetical protein